MYTFQDFQKTVIEEGTASAIQKAIQQHMASDIFREAMTADKYDQQKNTTIMNYIKWLYTADGGRYVDTSVSANRLCSNFFARLNTQRNTYSLGNGIVFENETVKAKLGNDFDTQLRTAGYNSLIHGITFLFWNVDHIHVFPVTQFAPLWDEETGALRAGVRFWQVDSEKPLYAVLYEEDGFSKYKGSKSGTSFENIVPKMAYRINYIRVDAADEYEIVGEENYSTLPIIPMYGSRLHQSTLVGMQSKIDAFDLIQSGFANDLEDCAEIYWIVNNAGGMTDSDLTKFRDRLKLTHIANIEDADGVSVTPHTQEIPSTSRKVFLDEIRASIYEDFGALDVHTVSAGATNDHIDAAYQPMDENADDYEYQIISAIQNLLKLQGIEDTPLFKRNRISNQKEIVDMVLESAQYLDDETVLNKLPFITPDEVKTILDKRDIQEAKRLMSLKEKNKK